MAIYQTNEHILEKAVDFLKKKKRNMKDIVKKRQTFAYSGKVTIYGYSNTPPHIFHKLSYIFITNIFLYANPAIYFLDHNQRRNAKSYDFLSNVSGSIAELQNFLTQKKLCFEHQRSFNTLYKVSMYLPAGDRTNGLSPFSPLNM